MKIKGWGYMGRAGSDMWQHDRSKRHIFINHVGRAKWWVVDGNNAFIGNAYSRNDARLIAVSYMRENP